jgi:dTDP-4-amino-4,6-dideoxygalactose transaminase
MIGGAHALAKKDAEWVDSQEYNIAYTANARSAIYVAFKMCNPQTIWFPSYTCVSVLHEEFPVRFYAVSQFLKPERPPIKPGDLVVAIEYFGFPIDDEFEEHVKHHRGILLKDKSQSLFSRPSGDFAVYSLVKQMGFSDGGLLYHNGEAPELTQVDLPDAHFRELRLKYDQGEQNDWYQEYLRFKAKPQPFGLFAMSEATRANLGQRYEQMGIRCRENYAKLQESLKPIFDVKDECPSGFPVISSDRDNLQKRLAESRIYCPIHWDLKDKIPKSFRDSYDLSSKILTIPCDWRYGEKDMEYIINANRKFHSDILR